MGRHMSITCPVELKSSLTLHRVPLARILEVNNWTEGLEMYVTRIFDPILSSSLTNLWSICL